MAVSKGTSRGEPGQGHHSCGCQRHDAWGLFYSCISRADAQESPGGDAVSGVTSDSRPEEHSQRAFTATVDNPGKQQRQQKSHNKSRSVRAPEGFPTTAVQKHEGVHPCGAGRDCCPRVLRVKDGCRHILATPSEDR